MNIETIIFWEELDTFVRFRGALKNAELIINLYTWLKY